MPSMKESRAFPERHRNLAEADLLETLRLEPGLQVAEIGAGSGRFTLALARAVGPEGRIFAIETEPEWFQMLRDRCGSEANIEPVHAPHHRTPLRSNCCDRILLANLWGELRDPAATLAEIARLLRGDGRLIIFERRAGIDLPELVQLLERNCWDIHRHGDAGDGYFLEVGVTDESVQS